jgi:hypothetical protein
MLYFNKANLRRASRLVRAAALDRGTSSPIVYVDGFEEPRVGGSSWHFETKNGTWIRHPGAYAKKGRRNMVYVRSTRHITVGAGWVLEKLLADEDARLARRHSSARPRTGTYYGMPIQSHDYQDGTWMEGEEFTYPHGGFHRRALARFPDGVRRVVRCSVPDTYFSVPARARLNGKTVRGFLSAADGGTSLTFTHVKEQ